jgi:hypothetical protein
MKLLGAGDAMKIKVRLVKLIWIAFLCLPFWWTWSGSAQADGLNPTQQIENLSITRIAPTEKAFGEKIWIVIQIENTGAEEVEFQFVEQLGNAEFDTVQALATLVDDPGYRISPPIPSTTDGFYIWRFVWKVTLKPGNKTYLTYWLIPAHAGDYVISPAQVIIASQRYSTASWIIKIACLTDGVCQASQSETVLNCPEDCKTGQADDICQAVLDGVIDPDCDDGCDPDDAQPTEPVLPSLPTETKQPAAEKVKFNPALCPGAVLLFGLAMLFQAIRHLWAWMMHL